MPAVLGYFRRKEGRRRGSAERSYPTAQQLHVEQNTSAFSPVLGTRFCGHELVDNFCSNVRDLIYECALCTTVWPPFNPLFIARSARKAVITDVYYISTNILDGNLDFSSISIGSGANRDLQVSICVG